MKTYFLLLLSAQFTVLIKAFPIASSDTQSRVNALTEITLEEAFPWINSKRDISRNQVDYNTRDLDDFIFPAEDDETPITSCELKPQKTVKEDEIKTDSSSLVDKGLQTKIRGYVSDWLESKSVQITRDAANRYVSKIYELLYGAESNEKELAVRKESDYEVANKALKKLRKAVVDVLNGYIYRPNVRNDLKALADDLISKVAVLNLRACPQTPEQRHFQAELKEVHIMSKRAIRKLNEALQEQRQ